MKNEMSLGEFEELVLRKWDMFTNNKKLFTASEREDFRIGRQRLSDKLILSFIARLNQSSPGFLEARVSSKRPADVMNAYRRSIEMHS